MTNFEFLIDFAAIAYLNCIANRTSNLVRSAMMLMSFTNTLDNRWETLMPIQMIWAKNLGLCLMPSGQN